MQTSPQPGPLKIYLLQLLTVLYLNATCLIVLVQRISACFYTLTLFMDKSLQLKATGIKNLMVTMAVGSTSFHSEQRS